MSQQFESGPADQSADDDAAFDEEGSANDEQNETECLHEPSVADTEALSPGRFYARLRTELSKRGLSFDKLPRLTEEGEAPPCFTAYGVNYDAWLAASSHLGALVPYRYDMPAEPNYCHDCRPEFRKMARIAGVCNFPDAKFERRVTSVRDGVSGGSEVEIVGVSRCKQKVISELQLKSLLE